VARVVDLLVVAGEVVVVVDVDVVAERNETSATPSGSKDFRTPSASICYGVQLLKLVCSEETWHY
jgi:hypothetical protein